MRTHGNFAGGAIQSIHGDIVGKIRTGFALAMMALLLFLALPAFASQQVFNSSGGTATLGTDFVLSGATATNPAGTLAINCPITSVGGSSPLIYSCTGGSFNFQSNDGLTTVTGSFTTAKLYLWAAGGGRGGNVHYTYEFMGDFTGVQDVNGVSGAINGETTAVIGPLTREIGSGSVTAGAGATGINSTYAPIFGTHFSPSPLRWTG